MTVKEKVNQFLQAKLQKLRSTYYTPVNLTQGQRNAMDVASGLATGVAKGVPGEQFLLNKMRVSVPKPTTLGGKVAQFVGETAPMFALTAGVGSALKGVKGVQLAQQGLGSTASKLIAKGGATKIIGQGIANMSKGIPYTLGYEAYSNLGQQKNPTSIGKSVGGNLAFDVATGALPLLGVGGMVVGKNALNYVNLPKITKTLDNLPKAEISDLSASLAKNWDTIFSKLKNQGETPVLADVLKHETLFKNYPSLKTMKIDIDPSLKGIDGFFDPNTNSIKLSAGLTREKFRSTLLHEVQHSIQQIEDFAKGQNLKNGKGTYLKSAGELEARSTQLREGMTAEQRKAINPYDQILSKEGINRGDVIVNKDNRISQSAKVPKEVVGESNQVKSAGELPEKLPKNNQTYQPYSVPSKPIIPRNLFNEIQTNAKSIDPSVETMQKISKKVDIDVGKEKAYKLEQAKKLITNSIKENTSGVIEKDVKLASNNILNSSGWKDKSKLFLKRETMSRNFDDVMGKDASNMKKVFLDPVGKSEADRIRFVNKERTDIKALGIKPNSKESSMLQMYGEGKITLENLKKQTPNWQKIVDAEKVFRQKYDTYLSNINQALVKNGYDPIPKRKDYFLHFNDVGNILENFGIPVKADLLPTDINGLTADFKPGKNFFTSALERKGDMTKFDAISGIDKYLNGASKQIYMTDNIQRLRMLEQALRDKNAGTTHLTNFVADLGEYINNIAGKKSMLDRGLEDLVGRRIYTGANALKSQVGANAVGANVSSALTNFIPLTQALATTNKVSFLKGMLQTISGVGKSDGFINKSDFLTRRFGSDPLSIKLWNNIGKKASWLFSTIDKFTSETIVRGKYLDGLNKGLSESQAMAKADDWAAKVIADRSVGQMPTLFTSKTLGFLTQFQLEVNNQLSFILKDIPRNFSKPAAASAIGQVFLYGYLYNQLYEKLTGRRPALDPIGWAQKAYQDSKNPNINTLQKINNVKSDVTNQLPFVSTFTGGRVPIANAVPNITNIYKSATKDGGPDLLGIGKELVAPAINLLPTGGSQLKKTIQGISAFNKGYVGEPDSVKFPVEKNLPNLIRMGVFGPYSTPEASAYFRSGVKPLSEKQSAEYLKKLSSEGYIKSEDSPQNILQTAGLYGEGFIKDFPGTIYALSKGNPIRKVRGDAVVLERQKNLSKLDSGDTTTQVDHIIAVAVGGTNEPDNLRVLSTADNQAKAKIDAKLANMLESGEITKEEAEKTMLSIKDMYPSTPIIPVDTSKDYYQKVLSDRIANKNKTPASSTASTSTTSEEDNYPYKLNSAKLTNFYNSGDYLSWMRTASEQVTLLSEQYKSATDELEKVQIANKIATLQNKIKKYGSYRGFKAPKKLKKITFKKTAHKKLAKINIKPLGTTRAKSILWAQPKLKAPVGVDLESLRHPKIG